MNATIGIVVVAAVIVGVGVLVQAGLLTDSYAQTAIAVVLSGGVSGTAGFALGKKQGPTPVVLGPVGTVTPIDKLPDQPPSV